MCIRDRIRSASPADPGGLLRVRARPWARSRREDPTVAVLPGAERGCRPAARAVPGAQAERMAEPPVAVVTAAGSVIAPEAGPEAAVMAGPAVPGAGSVIAPEAGPEAAVMAGPGATPGVGLPAWVVPGAGTTVVGPVPWTEVTAAGPAQVGPVPVVQVSAAAAAVARPRRTRCDDRPAGRYRAARAHAAAARTGWPGHPEPAPRAPVRTGHTAAGPARSTGRTLRPARRRPR